MKILILEDDPQRHKLFLQNLTNHDVTITEDAELCIKHLQEEDWDWLFLDHDLGGEQMVASGNGTGYQVAVYLHGEPQRKPRNIVVHSFNPAGADNMRKLLQDDGSNVPYAPGVWAQNNLNEVIEYDLPKA